MQFRIFRSVGSCQGHSIGPFCQGHRPRPHPIHTERRAYVHTRYRTRTHTQIHTHTQSHTTYNRNAHSTIAPHTHTSILHRSDDAVRVSSQRHASCLLISTCFCAPVVAACGDPCLHVACSLFPRSKGSRLPPRSPTPLSHSPFSLSSSSRIGSAVRSFFSLILSPSLSLSFSLFLSYFGSALPSVLILTIAVRSDVPARRCARRSGGGG